MNKQGFSRRYRGCCYAIAAFLISLCFLPVSTVDVYALDTGRAYLENTKNILILNSYDEGYRWTSEQSNEISEKLKASFDDIQIFVEYMDWKNHPEAENLERLYGIYKYKYSDIKLDVIFATDNIALEFALKHRKEFLSDATIVFSGITKRAAETILMEKDNVVGVFEIHDPVGTMKAASKINPDIKNVYIIHDNTETGWDSEEVIYESRIQDNYHLYYLNNLTIDQIVETVSGLGEDSIVLLGAYTIDAGGLKRPADKFVEVIGKASAVPVYDMWNFRMGNGVLGGSILRGTTMGDKAAALGIRILRGEPVKTLDNIEDSVVEYVFDYQQMERFSIPLKALPEGSLVINKPFSFFETYKNLVIATALVFVVMALYIILLIKNIQKRKRAENELNVANEELQALYEQVTASDLQLKEQLEELISAHNKVQVNEEKYRLIAESANDIIWEWDLKSNKLQFSSRLKGILGYENEEISAIGDWNDIILPEDQNCVKGKLDSMWIDELRNFMCDYRVRSKNGKILWLATKARVLVNEFGYPHKIVGSHTDITQLKEHQNNILHMAYHDTLTKLPNRSYLKEYVDGHIHEAPDELLALVYIDIDNFKTINDSFGHSEGDKFLVEIGKKFSAMTGEDSMVFRLGGDEYVIILKNVRDRKAVEDYLENMFRAFAEPVNIENRNMHITLSAGAVVYPSDGVDFNELLKHADIAMYQVKNRGKNNFIFFSEGMKEGIKEKMLLENSLRDAVVNMKFLLNYQPILDIASGRIYGFEALIRWNSRDFGPVSPAVFIKLAEENGLIIPIGNWVLKTGCSFAARLAELGYPEVSLSINISPLQLMQTDFVENVKAIVNSSGVQPDRIELEVTESMLIDSFDTSLKKLKELRMFGIRISLDDFGQGYSSLTYLRRLPINTLKIDKAFIDDIFKVDSNNQIVYSIIELAHRMQLKVNAEGVETEEQYNYLKHVDCDAVQGYLISRPVPEAEVLSLLQKFGTIKKMEF